MNPQTCLKNKKIMSLALECIDSKMVFMVQNLCIRLGMFLAAYSLGILSSNLFQF